MRFIITIIILSSLMTQSLHAVSLYEMPQAASDTLETPSVWADDATKTPQNKIYYWELGTFLGGGVSKLDFSSSVAKGIASAEFGYTPAWSVGGFANLMLPHNGFRWSVRNELGISHYASNTKSETINSPTDYTKYDFTFKMTYLRNSLMGRYHPIKYKSLDVSIFAGLFIGFRVADTDYTVRDIKLAFNEYQEKGPYFEKLKSNDQGYLLGINAAYKRFSLDARYTYSNGFSTIPAIGSNVKSYFVTLSYRFGRWDGKE